MNKTHFAYIYELLEMIFITATDLFLKQFKCYVLSCVVLISAIMETICMSFISIPFIIHKWTQKHIYMYLLHRAVGIHGPCMTNSPHATVNHYHSDISIIITKHQKDDH